MPRHACGSYVECLLLLLEFNRSVVKPPHMQFISSRIVTYELTDGQAYDRQTDRLKDAHGKAVRPIFPNFSMRTLQKRP
jgi:hypothetical protein